MGEWIGVVEIPPHIAAKIKGKHGLTPDEVREAVCWGAADEARWHEDATHGRRLLAIGTPYHDRYRVLVVLVPVDRAAGIWRCKTAIRWTR